MNKQAVTYQEVEDIFDRKVAVLIEHMDDQFERVAEAIDEVRQEVSQCAKKSDLEEVKSDIRIIKTAINATNQDIKKHGRRLTRLEKVAHAHA